MVLVPLFVGGRSGTVCQRGSWLALVLSSTPVRAPGPHRADGRYRQYLESDRWHRDLLDDRPAGRRRSAGSSNA